MGWRCNFDMLHFDEFFKWNYNLKITRQTDLVLRYLANDRCNLTNFASEFTIWNQLVKLTWFCAIKLMNDAIWRLFQVTLQFENNSSNWLVFALCKLEMLQFDDFFKPNCNLKFLLYRFTTSLVTIHGQMNPQSVPVTKLKCWTTGLLRTPESSPTFWSTFWPLLGCPSLLPPYQFPQVYSFQLSKLAQPSDE